MCFIAQGQLTNDLNTLDDGDTISLNILYTKESIDEVDRILNSPEYYITPDGSPAYSVKTNPLNLVLAHMTDTINILKVLPYQTVVSKSNRALVIDQLVTIYKQAFNGKLSKENFDMWIKQNIEDKGETLLLAVNGKYRLKGYIRYRIFDKNNTEHVFSKLSRTDKYGYISDLASTVKGAGTKLMNDALLLADNDKLDVILSLRDDSLIDYYTKFGFQLLDTSILGSQPTKKIMIRYSSK